METKILICITGIIAGILLISAIIFYKRYERKKFLSSLKKGDCVFYNGWPYIIMEMLPEYKMTLLYTGGYKDNYLYVNLKDVK